MRILIKIIEYSLYLLSFVLPWQTRWIIKKGTIVGQSTSEFLTYSLYGADIILVLLIFLFAILKISNFQFPISNQIQNPKNKIYNIWLLIALLDLFAFISIFFAFDKWLAFYKYGWLLLGVGLFWVVTSANYNKTKLVFSFLAGIFIQAGIGIWQFITQSSFASKWLGMAFHDPSVPGVSVVEIISSIDGVGERWLRAYGGMEHPNILGGVLAVGIILAIIQIIKISNFKFPISNQIQNSKVISQNFKSKFKIYLLYIFLVVFFTALFFTFSRGAWIGCAVGIATLLFINIIQKNFRAQKEILIIILIFGLFSGILTYQYKDLVFTRISNQTRLEIKSETERIASYREAWQLIKKHPLLGAGMGNYVLAVKNEVRPDMPSFYYQLTHNVYLLVWSEIGIIGLLSFILLIIYINFKFLIINFKSILNYSIFKHSIKISNLKFQIETSLKDVNVDINYLAITPSLLVMFLFDHWWWSLHFGVLFLWFILGLIYKKDNELPEKAQECNI